ncbi:MAG: IucA/IucC family protein, partial [Thiohalorhabdaceae bacterium]
WRLRALPAVWQQGQGSLPLAELDAILETFAAGLDGEDQEGFRTFAEECHYARQQRALCEEARQRLFARPADSQASPSAWPAWARRLFYYDRLAAFHDHPFYPTAGAKLGFDAAALRAYAPEFAPRFQLRWLAVPRALYNGPAPDPALWPDFT